MQKSILIIEDESDIREPMADALKQAGYRVFTAENGEIGLRLATANEPDLILLDLMMPVMDGHDMLERLRISTWGKTAKVIVMTAMDDVENIGKGFEHGISDYIVKSNMSLKEILKVIRYVLAVKE